VDLAASTGGNVEGSVPDQEVMLDGVRVIGLGNMPGEVARDASQMYASNVANLLEHAWNKEQGGLVLDPDDPVVGAVLLTHGGVVRDPRVRAALESHAAETPSERPASERPG
jgi:H+-translocating NAD(P) transhydrogenase subunit alpha